jgi:hypothetical protein
MRCSHWRVRKAFVDLFLTAVNQLSGQPPSGPAVSYTSRLPTGVRTPPDYPLEFGRAFPPREHSDVEEGG